MSHSNDEQAAPLSSEEDSSTTPAAQQDVPPGRRMPTFDDAPEPSEDERSLLSDQPSTSQLQPSSSRKRLSTSTPSREASPQKRSRLTNDDDDDEDDEDIVRAPLYDLYPLHETTPIIRKITFNDGSFTVKLKNGTMAGPFDVDPDFFNNFLPDHTFTIDCKHSQTLQKFYDCCANFRRWARFIVWIKLRGEYSSRLTYSFVLDFQCYYFNLTASKFHDVVVLNDWLNTLPMTLHTLIIDARPFKDSFFYEDIKKICKWMRDFLRKQASVMLYTTEGVCHRDVLLNLLQDIGETAKSCPGMVLTVICPMDSYLTSDEEYALSEVKFEQRPVSSYPLYDDMDVTASYTFTNDDYTFNIGFARKQLPLLRDYY